MGLEEEQPAAEEINKIVERRESNNEVQRQRLLQALEKCNEDLEALKKIIVSAQASKKNLIQSTQSMAKKEEIINDSNSPLNNCYNKFNVPTGMFPFLPSLHIYIFSVSMKIFSYSFPFQFHYNLS